MLMEHPQEVHRMYREAFNARDLEGLIFLFESNATYSPEPGVVMRGKAAIRKTLGDLMSLKPTLEMETISCKETAGVAILRSQWRFTGTQADGLPLEVSGEGVELLRPQKGGGWKIARNYSQGTAAWRLVWATVLSQAVVAFRIGLSRFIRAWFNRLVRDPIEHVLLIQHVPGADGTQHRVYPKALLYSTIATIVIIAVFGGMLAWRLDGIMGLLQYLWTLYLIFMGALVTFAVAIVTVIFWVAFR